MADTGKMERYKKYPGFASMDGQLYEINVAALLFLRCMLQAETFKLASCMQDAGAFDDIVLCFKDKVSKLEKTYLIQIKHKRKKGLFDRRALCAMKGDFSLIKYFHSYAEVRKNFTHGTNVFVIFTNAQVKGSNYVISEENDMLNCGGKIISFTKESEEYNAFKELAGDTWDEFINNLKLYTEQPTLDQLDNLVKVELKNLCSSSEMFSELKNGMTSWWITSNQFLTEKTAPFWENILQHHASDLTKAVSSKLSALSVLKFKEKNKVSINTHVTHIICRGGTELSCIKICQSLSGQHFLINKDVLQERVREVLFLWNHFRTLVVVGNSKNMRSEVINQLSNALHMDRDKKIIFISDDTDVTAIKFTKLFPSTSNIDIFNVDLLTDESQEFIMNCQVEFQGFVVKLKTIVVDLDILTEEVIIDIVQKREMIKVGREIPSVDDTYIPRTLLRQETVSEKIFGLTEIDCIALSGISLTEVQSLVPEGTTVEIFTDVGKINRDCKYFIVDGEHCFDQLCEMRQQVHWLEKSNQSFVWRKSKGDITFVKNNLKQNALPTKYQSICQVLAKPEQLVLMVADPGMGKTTEVMHLAREFKETDPSTWVVLVNLIDHTDVLCQDSVAAIDLLCKAGNFSTTFEKSLFQCEFFHRGNILTILDGFDEVCPVYMGKVVDVLKEIMHTKHFRVCLTSRTFMKNYLEMEFSTLTFSLNILSREDQIKLLGILLHISDLNNPRANNFVIALLDLYGKSLNDGNDDFTCIPFHCKMLCQLFERDAMAYITSGELNLPANLDLMQIYDKYINFKFELYISEKLGIDSPRVFFLIQEMKMKWVNDMTLCALVSFLSEDDFALLSDSEGIKTRYQYFLGKFNQDMEKTGMLQGFIQNKPVFVHKSFVEYFVALWLSQNCYENRKLLCNKLFEPSWKVIKLFLDRMLCVGFKIHTLVLDEDLPTAQHLLKSQNVDVNEMDSGGRTPLHLACSQNKGDHDISNQLINFLLDYGADTKLEDGLFKWKPLKFAAIARSWFAIEILLERGANRSDLDAIKERFDDRDYVNDLIKSSVMGGMKHILQFITKLSDGEGNSFLHYAAQSSNEEIITLLLKKHMDVNVSNARKQTPLHLALENGRLHTVQLLLKYGANLSACDSNGNSFLHYSARNGDEEIAELLLSHGAHINARNCKSQLPLHIAVEHRRVEIVKLLLLHGADPTINDSDGNSLLHYAARNGDEEIVTLLLYHGAHIDAMNCKSQLPLHIAVEHRRTEIVKLLLESGSDPTVIDRDNFTLLHFAAECGHVNIIKMLLDAGSDVDARNKRLQTPLQKAFTLEAVKLLLERGADPMSHDIDGRTLLHQAAEHGSSDIVHFLLNKGIDINAKGTQSPSPVHLAVKNGTLKVVELLIEHGADLMDRDDKGNTLLHIAAEHGHEQIVKLLLEHEIDIDARNDEMKTASHLAAAHNRMKILKLLLVHGADAMATDVDGNTLVHYAAVYDAHSIIHSLIKWGVNVNFRNKDMQTPIYKAVKSGRLQVVKELLDYGADIYTCDSDGNSVLHYAVTCCNEAVVELLVQHEADVNLMNRQGDTPLHLAVKHDSLIIVEILIQFGADVEICDLHGQTALHYATENVKALLIKHAAA